MGGKNGVIDRSEEQQVAQLSAPRSLIIYEVVRRQGEEELARPPGSLFWSGVAAGVALMTSVIVQGALRAKLPDVPWREPICELGYSVGFIMVILGRMQLFTEQTIVAVLPNMAAPRLRKLLVTARLWAIVFVANMVGAALAAAINLRGQLMSPPLLAAMLDVSGKLLGKSWLELMLHAIPAGFLIASVAWIRAGVASGELWVVILLTYAIALGDFNHVVAGADEAFLLLFAGKAGLGTVLGGMILPALIGNVIGGTGLFALLAHAQVRQEMAG